MKDETAGWGETAYATLFIVLVVIAAVACAVLYTIPPAPPAPSNPCPLGGNITAGMSCDVPSGEALFYANMNLTQQGGWVSFGFTASNATGVAVCPTSDLLSGNFAYDDVLNVSNVTTLAVNATLSSGNWMVLWWPAVYGQNDTLNFTQPLVYGPNPLYD
jgi:hypothetical protein